MKKILTYLLFVLITISFFTFTSGANAADADGVMFTFSYHEKTNGVVDNKQTAKLSKITVDGEKVLKIVKKHKEIKGMRHFNSTPVGYKYQISLTIF